MNLSHLFDLSLAGRKEAVALEFAGTTYTFGEIDSRSNRMAQLLIGKGLRTGDRLCVYLANSVDP
jgi:malonyl-CoA/methylmalonyl-CoA synthetase